MTTTPPDTKVPATAPVSGTPTSAAALTATFQLRHGASVDIDGHGDIRLTDRSRSLPLGSATPAGRDILLALSERECTEDDLLTSAAQQGGGELVRAFSLLETLRSGNWLTATLRQGGRRILTLCPLTGRAGVSTRSCPAGNPVSAAGLLRHMLTESAGDTPGALVLSRFALVRREGDGLVLESPLSPVLARLADPALLAMLASLAQPRLLADLVGVTPLPDATTALAARLLVACALVLPASATEASDPELAQWAAHELWFHARSRRGRHDLPWGGTFWARERGLPMLPARPTPAQGPWYPLHKPDLAEVARRDPALTDVLERRRSVREQDAAAPLTSRQLGEFLYRTARTRGTWHSAGMEVVSRPCPSGGALHELELYPLVSAVDGIEPGLYHYDSHGHRLGLIARPGPLTDRLTRQAAAAAATRAQSQVVIVVTARFGRVMRKYQSMAYALTLKNVGVLYQAMYLVATAMGLAPCALGDGDSDLFAQVSGLDYTAESSVGEFLLGSAPAKSRR